MKHIYLLIISIFLLSNSLDAQLFNKRHSLSSSDYFNLYSNTNNTGLQLSDGNFLLTCPTMSWGAIVKIDQNGDTVWCRKPNYIMESAQSSELLDGSTFIFSSNGWGLYGSRVTATGDLSWSNTYTTMSNVQNQFISHASDGTNAMALQGTQSDTIFALSTDQNGTTLFFNSIKLTSLFGGSVSNSTRVERMIYMSSGNYLIAAKAITDNGIANSYLLIEMDTGGNILSIKSFDYGDGTSIDDYWCNSLFESSNGDIIMTGIVTVSGVRNSSVLRFDSGINYLSGMRIADDAFKANGCELSNGELALSCENSYLVPDGTPKNAIMKLTSSGNFIWGRTFGSTSGNGVSIIGESNNTIQVVGSTTGFGTGDLLTYNADFQGNATGCFDVISFVAETPFSVVLGVETSSIGSKVVSVYPTGGSHLNLPLPASDVDFNLSGVVTNPLCNEETGNIAIDVNDGAAPYDFSWSNGTNSQNLVNVIGGNYSLRVSDNKGCVKLDTFDIIEPTEVSATSVISDVTCFGSQNGSIDITPTGGIPGYTYLWATQDITEDISGLSGGFYQVTIVDANGCDEQIGFAISEPQQLFAAITNSQNVSCYGACDGSLTGLGSGGTPPYVLEWNDPNNTIGANVSNLCPGNYLFTLTDDNNCISYSNGTITEPLPISSTTATAGSECGVANGEASIDVIGGTMPYSYLWSNSDVTDTTSSLEPGSYDVSVTDFNGCTINESVIVNTLTNPVEICVVTVDSVDNKNMIVWEKPTSLAIQGFYVYRNIAGAYSQVGYQPYDSISQFIDNSFGVDPAVTSYRYEISVLDSCGNESELSDFHETIHLTSNLGLNDEVNLIWDDYEGFVFTQYNILRDSTGNGDWEQIANVANTSFTYTDLTPPQSSSLRYLVEVVLPSSCSATKAQDHNTTRSNRATITEPNASSIEELILSQASVYPNPNNGLFNVNVKSDNWSYSLFDMSGKLISNEMVSETNKEINIQELETGVYLMKINLEESSVYKKVIKH